MIGARVIKTCLAVAISILLARVFKLETPQFAGIVAVLAVQPSIYRSFRYGVRQTVSAVMGAVFGALALYAFGNSFLVMGLVAFFLMTVHVRINWTSSLLVAVVIAINTMGTANLPFWEAALNQISLVLIGTGTGTLVNLFQKPVHRERAEVLAAKSEGMLRSLLYYLSLEMRDNRTVPYSVMKEQIDHVRTYIEKGKEISVLIDEDKRFGVSSYRDTRAVFQSVETLLERIRDMSKELQKMDLSQAEPLFLKKALSLAIVMQERLIRGRSVHLALLKAVLERRRTEMWGGENTGELACKLACYNFYGYLREYLRELNGLQAKNPENREYQASGSASDF